MKHAYNEITQGEMIMKVKLTEWNKLGDHPLVKEITNREFEYEEARQEGAGVINNWQLVYPSQFIVEINGEYIGVINKEKAEKILKQKN